MLKIIRMKLIETYIEKKNSHLKFFQIPSEDRIKHKDEMIVLKHDCDDLERRIVKAILSFTLDYDSVFKTLKENDFHYFLKDDVAISRFRLRKSLGRIIGFNESNREKVINGFKDLCREVWEDHLITGEERGRLNSYCNENSIDKTQQFLIEQEIKKGFNDDDFDIEKTIEYYLIEENLDVNQIQKILSREYSREVTLSRLEYLSSHINEKLSSIIDVDEGESKLIKTIHLAENTDVFLFIVNGNLQSSFEFDLGYDNEESFKVIIRKDKYEKSSKDQIIDILADAMTYKMCSDSHNMSKFLEMKPLLKDTLRNVY